MLRRTVLRATAKRRAGQERHHRHADAITKFSPGVKSLPCEELEPGKEGDQRTRGFHHVEQWTTLGVMEKMKTQSRSSLPKMWRKKR